MSPTARFIVDGLARLPQFAHGGWTGDVLHVAGTLGTTEGMTLAEGVGPQTTAALENMGRILESQELTWEAVAKVDVFLADMTDSPAYNEAYGAFFADRLDPPPARITVGGCDLALDASIEMQCVAHRPSRATPEGADPSGIRRRTRQVEHDGESLYVEVLGDGGTPLVLCHGLGGNHAVWLHQAAHHARTRTVVLWDHRGFGRSTDRAGRTGPEVAVSDLLAICDALELTSADFVGQSMGGWTVAGAALARPELVRSLVLADSLGGFTSPAVVAATPPISGGDLPGLLGAHPAIDPSLVRRNPAQALLYQQLGGMGSMDPTIVIPRILGTTHDAKAAATVTCPVLCIVGERDGLFPPAAVRAVADLLPNARVTELAGCGHSPYFEQPDVWNAVVDAFFDAVDRGDLG